MITTPISPSAIAASLGRESLSPRKPTARSAVQIGVDIDRPTLDERIARRVEEMFAAGFVEEVEALLVRGLAEGPTAQRAIGYREVGWNVSGDDWEPANSAADVTRAVVDGVLEHGDGSVVLHHTWPDQMLAAIPDIVGRLKDAGATFVGLDELPDLPGLRVEPQIVGDR